MLSFLFHYVNLPKGELFVNLCVSTLIDWGWVTHICVGNLAIIGSDNCLSPGRRHAIIWTDAGILLIGPSETDFNEILIKNHTFSFKKIYLKMSPDSKVHEANMGPIWGRQDPGGPQVGPMNFAIWVVWKMAAILSWPPCVNILRPSDAYIPGGGTHYVRVMGRLRGIDPPFSRHWKKISILDPLFQGACKNIDFRTPFFRILRKKVNFTPLFSPRHRL